MYELLSSALNARLAFIAFDGSTLHQLATAHLSRLVKPTTMKIVGGSMMSSMMNGGDISLSIQSNTKSNTQSDTQSNAQAGVRPSCYDAPLYLPIGGVLIMILAERIFWPQSTVLFSAAMVCVFAPWPLIAYGIAADFIAKRRQEKLSAQFPTDADLPLITILLPLHKEANMIPQLADMLLDIDYPASRLECLVLMEADDLFTLSAAIAFDWPPFCRLMSMPRHGSTTKARACNYALKRARGSVLVIFDAEDRPHPLQLREAAESFAAAASANDKLACLQAPLDIRPQKNQWLQWQFALEYKILFHLILPSLDRACAALPLGGSSNYFRTDILRHLGGWDDCNLTEDAELAVRLSREGYHTRMLRHATVENAPHDLSVWQPQRTRWHSGHIQTLHTHAIPTSRRGIIGWFVCMLILLSRLLSGPVYLIGAALVLSDVSRQLTTGLSTAPPSLLVAVCMYGAWVSLSYFYATAPKRRQRIFLALTHPFYWMMTVWPLLRACKRMAFGQVNWLKSPHLPYAAAGQDNRVRRIKKLERVKGIEPSS